MSKPMAARVFKLLCSPGLVISFCLHILLLDCLYAILIGEQSVPQSEGGWKTRLPAYARIWYIYNYSYICRSLYLLCRASRERTEDFTDSTKKEMVVLETHHRS